MRIFVICDSPYLYTGLARVNRHVIDGLSNSGHEVILGAWGWDQLAFPLNENSQWIYRDQSGRNYSVFPLAKNPEKLLIQTYEVMKEIKCDILLTMGDYWNFAGFDLLKPKLNYGYKWIAYYTIESRPINDEYVEAFKYIDEIICPSIFGKNVVESSTDKQCHYIPYGVDQNVFYKLDEKTRIEERKKRGLEGKFRFINVSKNQNRKNIPAFLEALKIVHDVDNRVVGYLHTNIEKLVPTQVNLKNIIKRLGIEDIVSVPNKKLSLDIGYLDSDLNIEYGCSDAFVMSSVAEGFGLPILEAQSCGLPAIVTGYSSMKQLCRNKRLLVDYVKYYASMEQEVAIIKVEDLVRKMIDIMSSERDEDKNIEYCKGFYWGSMNERLGKIIEGLDDKIVIPVNEM